MSDLETHYFNRILQLEAERDKLKEEIHNLRMWNVTYSKEIEIKMVDCDVWRAKAEKLMKVLKLFDMPGNDIRLLQVKAALAEYDKATT